MDYLIVTYLCFAYNLPIPHVIAGDNLKFPLVGPTLQRGGAVFIRCEWCSIHSLSYYHLHA